MRQLFCTLLFLLSLHSSAHATNTYEIQATGNDEFFIINGEKFRAKTYCFGWDEGDKVIFIEGNPNGTCVSAKLYNVNNEKTCKVYCE
jgi:hypothetical protein